MAETKLQVLVGEHQHSQTVKPTKNKSYETGTRISRPSSPQVTEDSDEESKPTGWRTGVLVVLSSHFVVINTSGFTNSFGALQSYFMERFDQPSSTVSWIGSMQIFLFFFIGIFSGRLKNAGYFRVIFLLGSLANALGILAASFGNDLWVMFITLGLYVGVGNGSMSCSMLTVMSAYFSSRRGLAIGIAMCGSCTGGLVYSAIMRQLIPAIGFPWTMRVIALIHLVTLSVSNICLRPKTKQKKTTGCWVDWSAFQDSRHSYFALASFCVIDYSRTVISPPFSYPNSLNLLLIFNGINLIGRLGFSFTADRFETLSIFVPECFAGYFSGGVQTLFPAGLGYLTAGMEKPGTRIGMIFGIVSIASLIGSPIGGALIGAMNGRYLGAQIFAGTTMGLAALFLEAARRLDNRKSHDL
ncbi:hypothetical protein FSARC_7839 [Fusarium sarcochroum]|uniref:Major facilitator superfamily (MFS) profile domain-containing protein n=1 Tax=Fusarium sarcochroum TaxID=1208366 RepID=A0A8H4X7J3_9HYPO|nr:hypothetical protein FSARC_7839 [Fusarium sarcochroum]